MEISEEKHLGVTQIKATKFSYKWVIHNFDLSDRKTGESISSPSFNCYNKKDIGWCITLYPKGKDEESKDYMAIFLNLVKATNPQIRAVVSFSIINSEGKENFLKEFSYLYSECSGHGYPKFIKNILGTSLLHNNTLTILCRVRIDTQIENLTDNYNTKCAVYKTTLNNELEVLFKNKLLTDVTLIANQERVQAHKVILAAKSPVFLAMLQNEMKEKESSEIEIVDFEPDVINEMLLYLYTGRVENMEKYCYDLMRLADKYDIQCLKLLCEEYFCNKLCINKAIEMLIAADRHNCNTLRPQIMKFIVANAKDVVKTPEFKTLGKELSPLVMEMILAMT